MKGVSADQTAAASAAGLMDEEAFDRLCAACDELLKEGGQALVRVSTPWLHVLNEHPANLARYATNPGLVATLGKFVARLLGIRLVRALTRTSPWLASRPLPPRCDVLVFSHFLSGSQAGNPTDFYFGELPAALEAAGKSVVLVMRNHSAVPDREVVATWGSDVAPRLFLAGHGGIPGELRIAAEQLRHAVQLARRAGSPEAVAMHRRAAAQLLGGSTADNLAFFQQVRALVRATRPSAIVATYEGHAWERLAFAAARSVEPRIRCIGYHHAVLFPRQHAISRALSARFDPDTVLFAGEVARERFARRSSLPARLEVVGTQRNDQPIPRLAPKLAACDATPSCLVLPDGTPSECLLLTAFAVDCALRMPSVRFIVRLHPVVSFKQLVQAEPSLRHLPANVTFSKQSIDADFAACRWALYRGSGAGVRAASVGLRPFYLQPTGEALSMDPLYELSTWRKVVTTADQFRVTVEADRAGELASLEAEFASVRTYLQAYFLPMDAAKFVELVAGEPSAEITPRVAEQVLA